MVAAVIITAVGDERVIAHPHGDMNTTTALVVLGGPALFLLGMLVFIRATGGLGGPERLASIACFAALLALGLAAPVVSPLALASSATVVLLTLVAFAAVHAGPGERAERQ